LLSKADTGRKKEQKQSLVNVTAPFSNDPRKAFASADCD